MIYEVVFHSFFKACFKECFIFFFWIFWNGFKKYFFKVLKFKCHCGELLVKRFFILIYLKWSLLLGSFIGFVFNSVCLEKYAQQSSRGDEAKALLKTKFSKVIETFVLRNYNKGKSRLCIRLFRNRLKGW